MINVAYARRRGLSIVELLVVVGILALVLGLLLPTVQSLREVGARAACTNNLKQLGMACHHYNDVNGTLPAPYIVVNYQRPTGYTVSWTGLILPYIEQGQLWQQIREAYQRERLSWVNPPHVGLATVVRTFVCPSDARLLQPITDDVGLSAAYASYAGVAGGSAADGAVGGVNSKEIWPSFRGVTFAEIRDGASSTLLLGEKPPLGFHLLGCWYSVASPFGGWSQFDHAYEGGLTMTAYTARGNETCTGPFWFGPGNLQNPCDSHHFWSLHPGGANFAFCDGSVRFLSYSARSILPALATRAGGEAVAIPD